MVLKLLCMLYSVGYCVLGQYSYDYNNDTYDTTSYTYDDVNSTYQYYDDITEGKIVYRGCGYTKEDRCGEDSNGDSWCLCTSQYCNMWTSQNSNRAENVKMQALMCFTVSAFLAAAKKFLI